MKRVLVVHYSQTGQLGHAVESLVGALDPEVFEVTLAPIRPSVPYPFPWSVGAFFGAFPDTVLGRAPEIEPLPFDATERFDLVVLGLTVWYLRPSLPIQGFFASPYARVLAGTPVVTVIACRNMWHTASERAKRAIAELGGEHADNVVVTDRGPTWATFVTTPRWMFTGKKDAFWFFPPAGVAGDTGELLAGFGRVISDRAGELGRRPVQPFLTGRGAVRVDPKLILPEMVGRAIFPVWARVIAASGRPGSLARAAATCVFVVFLATAILILVPLCALARLLLYPFLRGWYKTTTLRLESPSGSGSAVV